MRDISEQTLDCFTHGLAHLIAELGFEQGLALAGKIVVDLADGPRVTTTREEVVASGGGER